MFITVQGGIYLEKVSNPSVADISQILEKEMGRLGYSAFCIRATHLLSKQLCFFMEQHGIETYDHSVGAMFQDSYCQHHIGERQLIGVKLFVTRFNSIFSKDGFVPRRKLVVPVELPATLDKLLIIYKEHCSDKGNCAATIQRNELCCRRFLKLLADDGIRDSDEITSATVSVALLRVTSVRAFPAIRAFLQFLAENEYLERDYSFLVPRVRPSQPIPSVYSIEEIQRIEAQVRYDAINGVTTIRKRDYAMLLMATRFGLRPCDIVSLTFSELDFQKGAIRIVQEKTDTPLELPMLPVIRDALLDYINHARGDPPVSMSFCPCSHRILMCPQEHSAATFAMQS